MTNFQHLRESEEYENFITAISCNCWQDICDKYNIDINKYKSGNTIEVLKWLNEPYQRLEPVLCRECVHCI